MAGARASRKRAVAEDRPARRLDDAALVDLIMAARECARRAAPQEAPRYAAARVVLELEAMRRGIALPKAQPIALPPVPSQPAEGPAGPLALLERVLAGGREDDVWEVLSSLGPDEALQAWQIAQRIPDPELQLERLTAICLVLDQRVFGEVTAEHRHRQYALMPVTLEERLVLVNDAIRATFGLLRLRPPPSRE